MTHLSKKARERRLAVLADENKREKRWWEMEKVSLYKFTHISLLKNDGHLKQKSDKQPKKKKKTITQFIKK